MVVADETKPPEPLNPKLEYRIMTIDNKALASRLNRLQDSDDYWFAAVDGELILRTIGDYDEAPLVVGDPLAVLAAFEQATPEDRRYGVLGMVLVP